MSITAIKGARGQEQAFCTCEDCGGEVTVSARHGDNRGWKAAGRANLTLHSEAAVIESLKKLGWSHVKNRLRCDKCTENRKDKPMTPTKTREAAKPTATAPRQPTAEMEVDIIVTLSAVYDRKAKRYSGAETDATVADVIGNGCMPGWVAAIRAEKFGPAGNEEAEAIRAEIERIGNEAAKRLDELAEQLGKLSARLDALYRSEDKRVRA